MSKRKPEYTEIEIDSSYESHVSRLSAVDGHVADYAIESARPQQTPKTWTPAQTPEAQHSADTAASVQAMRQMVDQQSQEPQRTETGNRFVINETTNAKDRAGAGFRWWLMLGASAIPLTFGVALWVFWGWGFFAFIFTCFGAGVLIGALFLNWQSISQSPITIEKKQRGFDHEYRMAKEENAQRTRELIIGGFIGGARGDMARNVPPLDGQLLLTDERNGVRK